MAIQPVAVADLALASVGVTASTWGPPSYDFTAGEVVLRLVYADGEAKAQVEFGLRQTEGAGLTLTRVFYDQQLAESGYEGDDLITAVPTLEQTSDFLALIRDATGVV